MEFIRQHIYLFILFLTITEGPITSFVSAGFAAQGILHIEYIILLAILGDVIGDIIFYIIGRSCHKIIWLKNFHYFVTQKTVLKKIFDKSPFFYFLIIKITPYLAIPSLISLGIKKMNFLSYMKYSLLVSLIVKAIYITAGYLGSFSLAQVNNFIDGRKTILLYGITGIIIFRGIKKGYEQLSKHIKEQIKKEIEEQKSVN